MKNTYFGAIHYDIHLDIKLEYIKLNTKNEPLAFLGWTYYILERLTILYAMFIFMGYLFSLLKRIYNTCTLHTQVNRYASVAWF